MKKPELTYRDHISNEEIKKGDVFHRVYEVISDARITPHGYEWKIHHRRWNTDLRMLRPDPAVLRQMDESAQAEYISAYQRLFIPMQLHPRIERFYDVRHIGGSAALFTEWSPHGTLRDCIEDGSLYRGEKDVVEERLLRIAGQTARAAQFLETEGVNIGAIIPENVMLTDRWNAKLSVANLMDSLRGGDPNDNRLLWAFTVLEMYLGRRIPRDADKVSDDYSVYRDDSLFDIPRALEVSVVAALVNKLPGWKHVFVYLDLPLEREYERDREYLRNNLALRLIDCGKAEEAARVFTDEAPGASVGSHLRYNLLLLYRYMSEMRDMLREPTDLLLYAEWNDRKSVERMLKEYHGVFPPYVMRYLPEIREKLLDRPRMTRTEIRKDDPRLREDGDRIVIELDGRPVTFRPLPIDSERVPIPGKDGLVWDRDRLILPDSGVIDGVAYTVRRFDGKRFLFDDSLELLLTEDADSVQLYRLAQYDNRFRAPFLLCTDERFEDEV